MIVDITELRVALGLVGAITEADVGLATLLQPLAEQAIIDELQYDPVYREATEFYPRNEAVALNTSGEADYEVYGDRARLVAKGVSEYLQLQRLPVRSITSVHVNNDGRFRGSRFTADDLWVPEDHYWLEQEEEGLSRSGNVVASTGWPIVPGSVKITYVAGYTPEEFAGRAASRVSGAGIKTACLITLVKGFKEFKAHQISSRAGAVPGIITSERMGDYNYAIDPSIGAFLAAFKIGVPPEAIAYLQPYRHYGQMLL